MKLLGHLSKGLESKVLYSVKSKSHSPNWTPIVSVFNECLRHFSIYIIKSKYILTTLDLGEILTCLDGYNTDLNYESDH